MTDTAMGRASHPCLARRCGHGVEAHVRTPELDTAGETVIFCAHCRRHEVRVVRRRWGGRRTAPTAIRALPLRAV